MDVLHSPHIDARRAIVVISSPCGAVQGRGDLVGFP